MGDIELESGQYYHRHGSQSSLGPYRLITHRLSGEEHVRPADPAEPPDWWSATTGLWEQTRLKTAQTHARSDVRLECGHLGRTLTDPDWKPGRTPRTDPDRTEEFRQAIEAGELFSNQPDERDHRLRVIGLALPSPAPETQCRDCACLHAVVRHERVGWLVRPPTPQEPKQPKPRMPSREEVLEARIRELEAENARLKGATTDA